MGMMSWLTNSSVSKRVRKDSEGGLCLLHFWNAKADEDLGVRQTILFTATIFPSSVSLDGFDSADGSSLSIHVVATPLGWARSRGLLAYSGNGSVARGCDYKTIEADGQKQAKVVDISYQCLYRDGIGSKHYKEEEMNRSGTENSIKKGELRALEEILHCSDDWRRTERIDRK
ncbi:hypothetical protein ARMGADRAFT_1027414 [Armillaria gallica]|uniref:Uncharacterized protein n=1 Tax=Armillaria gallica TaxID=47427 RepID=A0A2H3DM62_ARMGA|nr:hypothetical protein ARMGADRAFT_1027414 [Armillaria gallica]